jgi:hypothetical protein
MLNFAIIALPIKSLTSLTIIGVFLSLIQLAFCPKIKMRKLVNMLLFCAIITAITMMSSKIETLRYLYIFVLIMTSYTILSNLSAKMHSKLLIYLVLSISFIVILEHTPLREQIFTLFRASQVLLHAKRESSFFLYPGDLGAVSAILLSLIIYNQMQNEDFKSKYNLLCIALLIFCIVASQSRMAMLHIAISLLFFMSFNFIILSAVSFCLIFTLIYFGYVQVDYLSSTIDVINQHKWNLMSESSPLKRVQELHLMKNDILGKDIVPHNFYESGVVSLYFKLGFFSSIFTFFVFLTILIMSAIRDYRLLGIAMPIFLTHFISAPFDRPKLSVFTIWAVIFVIVTVGKMQYVSHKIKYN